MKYVWIQGKYYSQLGLYGGKIYLGKPTDVNNEVVKSGVIWEMQPFFCNEEVSKIVKHYFNIIRFFKVDIWGNSKFKKFLKWEKSYKYRIL